MKRMACAWSLACAACAFLVCPNVVRAGPQHVPTPPNLQLSILTPDPSMILDRVSLDVSFRGTPVDTVELYIDGKLAAKRQISTAQSRGVISFSLEALELTEGMHNVEVK